VEFADSIRFVENCKSLIFIHFLRIDIKRPGDKTLNNIFKDISFNLILINSLFR